MHRSITPAAMRAVKAEPPKEARWNQERQRLLRLLLALIGIAAGVLLIRYILIREHAPPPPAEESAAAIEAVATLVVAGPARLAPTSAATP